MDRLLDTHLGLHAATILLFGLIPALLHRGAAPVESPSPFCIVDPFTLVEPAVVCAPAGALKPTWSPEPDVERFAAVLGPLGHLWREIRSYWSTLRLESGDYFGASRWSALGARSHLGDPSAAWMSPPRSDLSQVSFFPNLQLDNPCGVIRIGTGLGCRSGLGQRFVTCTCLPRLAG
jgi:hypothetical protein